MTRAATAPARSGRLGRGPADGGTAGRISPGRLARLLGLPPPTPEQAAVISAPLQPLAVIAGAGSGKSETMAARVVWLVANGMVRPDQVLGLTFTRKAAAELAERVRAGLERLRRQPVDRSPGTATAPFGEDPTITTYHGYAARLVAEHALRAGLEPGMRLITPAESWQFASRVVATYDGPMDHVEWSPRTVTAAVLELAEQLAEHLRQVSDVTAVGDWLRRQRDTLGDRLPTEARKIIACQQAREQLLALVAGYQAEKAAREVLDHGDQVAVAARIATAHPEVGAVERARYAVVLLDEYQDTSHAQFVLLRALFPDGHPVTAVGDPCQSIYGWRGASAGNLQRFPEDFPVVPATDATADPPAPRGTAAASAAVARASGPVAPAPVGRLSTSFRNAGQVLDVAEVVARPLRVHAPDLPVLRPAPDRADRGRVTCALLESAADEAAWVAEQIAGLLASPAGVAPDGAPWPDGRSTPMRPCDIAVLCRRRSQFPLIRRAIEARGIPVEAVGLGGLLTVPEVQDIVATLRVVHDATASDALVRLLTGPRWRIGPRDLVALGRRARELAHGGAVADRSVADTGTPASGRPAGTAAPSDAAAAADRQDVVAEAITDLAVEPGSLVEALDDLGDPAAYSPAGYTRLRALAAELRALRRQTSRPLPDLIGEIERTLGLDIEVAARPGVDPSTARADLDALIDVAAQFAGEREEPTVGGFLAYLAAAEVEEFGLEAARPGTADTVKLATVHAAKGLQWAAVIVPGLAAGPRASVFPARPAVSTRWTDNPRLLPFGLRGDATDLPALRALDADSLAAFTRACAERDATEERRLLYVAITRAAFWLGCSGYWWGEGSSRLGPSVFLEEIRSACAAGAGTVARWTPPPPDGATNPVLAEPPTARWPVTATGERHAAVREAGEMVTAALRGGGPGSEDGWRDLPPADRDLVAAWRRDADLLLAERDRRDDGRSVTLPRHLSVTSLVTLARDPADLARQIRRPMPQPPAPARSRGTAFHRWLEDRYGQQQLIDDEDLFDADEASNTPADIDLSALREQFEGSEWARRSPCRVEVPFRTVIGDRLIRGRIDAVFDDAADGVFDVVDWKTGEPPGCPDEERAVAVQLAVYRLAWAALAGVSVDRVRAAFHYVRYGVTVRPADLLDERALVALIERVPVDQRPPAGHRRRGTSAAGGPGSATGRLRQW